MKLARSGDRVVLVMGYPPKVHPFLVRLRLDMDIREDLTRKG